MLTALLLEAFVGSLRNTHLGKHVCKDYFIGVSLIGTLVGLAASFQTGFLGALFIETILHWRLEGRGGSASF